MFYGWLRSGRTSRQQAENTLSSSGVSLNAFRESNAVTEKKVRTLMFSRVLEKDGNSFLILLSAASGNIKMPDLFIAVSSAGFQNIFTSLGIYYAPPARTITGSITMPFPGKNKSGKRARNDYDGIHFCLTVDLYSVAG
jgi:hypothetical protein